MGFGQKENELEISVLEIFLFVRVDHCKANKVNIIMQNLVQKAIGVKMLLPDPCTGVVDGWLTTIVYVQGLLTNTADGPLDQAILTVTLPTELKITDLPIALDLAEQF